MIKHILPYPLMSLALLIMWLLLHNSVSPAVVAGGVLASLIGPWAMSALEAERLRIRSVSALVRLAGLVVVDIFRSNLAVATVILLGKRRERTDGFIFIPLDLRHRYSLTMLALIITSTPGTLWVQYNANRGTLLLHVLDLVDESTWITLIKQRYERLLMEAFE